MGETVSKIIYRIQIVCHCILDVICINKIMRYICMADTKPIINAENVLGHFRHFRILGICIIIH